MMRITPARAAFAGVLAITVAGCAPHPETPGEVVVYSSVDEVFAQPIAEQFEKDSGVRVKLVPDTEETKSTGVSSERCCGQTAMGLPCPSIT